MPKQSIISLLILTLLLAACAPLSSQSDQPNITPLATDNPPPDAAQLPDLPTVVPQLLTPTPTPAEQVVVLTYEPHNIVMTAIYLQLENNQVQLTEAANQIATLKAESNSLETQVVNSSTQAAATAQANSGASGSSSGGSSSYNLPANVYPIVTVDDKAYIFITKRNNNKGAPIMEHYEPRVWFPPGTEAWVFKNAIKADGGQLYYESYDPDGETPPFKVYFKATQIQIRPPFGNPNPKNYPADVAKGVLTEKRAVHEVVGYDDTGKPIMDTYKPFIHYEVDQSVLIYPKYVIATGGSHWYPIYDPDGKPSGYLPVGSIMFPAVWE